MKLKKIDIREIEGFKLGNAENAEAATGVTVIISEEGAVAGVDVRGGGPATRETDLLRSENTVDKINAVVLSGGSAFGLEAASGVMRALADVGTGFKVGNITVPIVAGASLFDLAVGRSDVFPDVDMGIDAVRNHGAGTGASVGKMMGMDRAMKTGLGTFACGDECVQVGAIAAVNACADVYSGAGNIIAGLRTKDGSEIQGTVRVLKGMIHSESDPELSFSDIKAMAAEEAAKKSSAEETGTGNEKEDIARALMASYQMEQEQGESSAEPSPEESQTELSVSADEEQEPQEDNAEISSGEIPAEPQIEDVYLDMDAEPEPISDPEPAPEPESETVTEPEPELEYVDPETAIAKNRSVKESPYNQLMFEREALVLELLIKERLV